MTKLFNFSSVIFCLPHWDPSPRRGYKIVPAWDLSSTLWHIVGGFFLQGWIPFPWLWEELFVTLTKEDGEREEGPQCWGCGEGLKGGRHPGDAAGDPPVRVEDQEGQGCCKSGCLFYLFSLALGDQKSFGAEAGTAGRSLWRTPLCGQTAGSDTVREIIPRRCRSPQPSSQHQESLQLSSPPAALSLSPAFPPGPTHSPNFLPSSTLLLGFAKRWNGKVNFSQRAGGTACFHSLPSSEL